MADFAWRSVLVKYRWLISLFVVVFFVVFVIGAVSCWKTSRDPKSSEMVEASPAGNPVAALIVEELKTAQGRVKQAEADREKSDRDLQAATDAAKADPSNKALSEKAELAKARSKEAKERAERETANRSQLLTVGLLLGRSEGAAWMTPLLTVIFTLFALLVLIFLMEKMPIVVEATSRGMIAFLIAFVTVGIALILVLSTVVANDVDRAARFQQGKEVLTALLGILGTIVGFYFGTSQDQGGALKLDPVVVSRDGKKVSLRTAVVGGTGPYSYSIDFVYPADAQKISAETKGPIDHTVESQTDVDVSKVAFLIAVRDSEKRTTTLKHEPKTT